MRPKLAVSLGDPSGIGPEVTLKALADASVRDLADWILVGDAVLLEPLAGWGGYEPAVIVSDPAKSTESTGVIYWDTGQLTTADLVFGKVSAECGRAGLEYVRLGTQLCLAGQADGIVTAPLNKEAVALEGRQFTGHTEYIADLCEAPESRMLLVNDTLCVVHVSTHCSLAEATQLETERIVRTIALGHEAVARLRGQPPRIAVCGLNPHAGENGMFGHEEHQFIVPAIDRARSAGIDCDGPSPADTIFVQAVRGKYDLVVAMYHDQGHVAMKLLDFEHTVNVSLGMPIVRTSVDHGTAFDIAGQNQANADDMKEAMRLAVKMVGQR